MPSRDMVTNAGKGHCSETVTAHKGSCLLMCGCSKGPVSISLAGVDNTGGGM